MKARKASIFTKIVVLGIIIYAVVTLISLNGQLKEVRSTQVALAAEIQQAGHEKDAMEYSIEHADDPETFEEIARNKLGFVVPGEKIFFDINK